MLIMNKPGRQRANRTPERNVKSASLCRQTCWRLDSNDCCRWFRVYVGFMTDLFIYLFLKSGRWSLLTGPFVCTRSGRWQRASVHQCIPLERTPPKWEKAQEHDRWSQHSRRDFQGANLALQRERERERERFSSNVPGVSKAEITLKTSCRLSF